ncbi:ABC transporter substrate-binding protein [Actinomadura sp. DC4]|uniref:ABC transporter substrate-binding protein n=1 Tax=Actinomadura sp. DC4 TaxID=3055069 RepID=UPI0025B03076|nr:ABC transporter substrate-binding protein [Actinomadura sp. DC4]MDN3353281.1 ABC transporter substrate-binding protein [Actinomadura sp. DC4]
MHPFAPSRTPAVLAFAALFLAACGTVAGGEAVQGVRLVARGLLTTCTHLPYAPFQFERRGAVVGFDVDLMDLVARRLRLRQKVVDTDFTAITSGQVFATGECDVAAAGMTINRRRAGRVDFSRPYFDSGQVLMARRQPRLTEAGIGAGGMRVGVVVGTTGQEYARARGWALKAYENSVTELGALRTGQVDVLVQDDPVVRYWLTDRDNADFTIVAGLRTRERYGFAVRKGRNPGLLRMIDQVIARSKADGAYRGIYEKWMGPMPPDAG